MVCVSDKKSSNTVSLKHAGHVKSIIGCMWLRTISTTKNKHVKWSTERKQTPSALRWKETHMHVHTCAHIHTNEHAQEWIGQNSTRVRKANREQLHNITTVLVVTLFFAYTKLTFLYSRTSVKQKGHSHWPESCFMYSKTLDCNLVCKCSGGQANISNKF